MKIHFATTNQGKLDTLRQSLARVNLDCQIQSVDLSLPEEQTVNIRSITRQKVITAFEQLGQPVVAHDAGFFISAWNGFPGPFIKFVMQTIGPDGVLQLMSSLQGEDRNCEFREYWGYLDSRLTEPQLFEELIPGSLTTAKHGQLPDNAWSSLWLIFQPEGQSKTLAEMSEEDLVKWRQARNQGAGQLAEYLAEQVKQ